MQKTIECDIETNRLITMATRISTAIALIRQTSPFHFVGNARTRFFQIQLFVLTVMLLVARVVVGEEPKKVSVREPLPIQQKPIEYLTGESKDPIAQLNRRMEGEELKLEFSDRFGYLPAVLKELDIQVSSQLLRPHSFGLDGPSISSQRPLALYFNDDVVVRWFPGSEHLEISAQDSQKGTLFYTLAYRITPLRFEQLNVCMGCHNQDGWLQSGIAAPGHIVRSNLNTVEVTKFPHGAQTTHTLPLEYRWSGRYVTGTSSTPVHRGNLIWIKDNPVPQPVGNIKEEFDVHRYVTDTSDAVAHLVFDHQTFGLNLLSRLSYEHQLNVRSKIETIAVRYLLLVDEAPLDHPTSGKSDYSDWYQSRGPKDAEGRSLFDLELGSRLFRHRISPLIQSPMVQKFPKELKLSLFRRLNDILSGKEQMKGFSIPDADTQATLSVIRATVTGWPDK